LIMQKNLSDATVRNHVRYLNSAFNLNGKS